ETLSPSHMISPDAEAGATTDSVAIVATSPAISLRTALLRCLSDVCGDAHRDDRVGIAHRLALLDLVDDVHAFDHLAPHRILAVQPRRILEADEELRICGVRVLRTRHRAGAANMAHVRDLRLQVRLVRTAHAGSCRIAGLRHEAVDDAVEHDAVVKIL